MDHFEGLLAKEILQFCAKQANLTSVASPQKKKPSVSDVQTEQKAAEAFREGKV